MPLACFHIPEITRVGVLRVTSMIWPLSNNHGRLSTLCMSKFGVYFIVSSALSRVTINSHVILIFCRVPGECLGFSQIFWLTSTFTMIFYVLSACFPHAFPLSPKGMLLTVNCPPQLCRTLSPKQ